MLFFSSKSAFFARSLARCDSVSVIFGSQWDREGECTAVLVYNYVKNKFVLFVAGFIEKLRCAGVRVVRRAYAGKRLCAENRASPEIQARRKRIENGCCVFLLENPTKRTVSHLVRQAKARFFLLQESQIAEIVHQLKYHASNLGKEHRALISAVLVRTNLHFVPSRALCNHFWCQSLSQCVYACQQGGAGGGPALC